MSQAANADTPTGVYAPGRIAALFDRYEFLGFIGQGGMGTVYKGYHLSLKRFVAIKVLRLGQINRPGLAGRFLREMQAIGAMDHPNVVRASDAGEKNGLFYLVMDYLEGADLLRLLTGRVKLEPADACELARQSALGLEYIHQTFVHRDIKPSNLLLTPAGVVKILDLGLARFHEAELANSDRTPANCAVGTYDYMAPEQASGSGQIDGRTDIYSLGCTLFHLLIGQAPYTGPKYDLAARKLYAHGNTPFTALEQFQSIPEELRPVLLLMTAKDPGERYATAGEVALALAPFAVGSDLVRLLESVNGNCATTVQPLPVPLPDDLCQLTAPPTETRANIPAVVLPPAPLRRRSVATVALGAGLLLGLVALFLYFSSGRPDPDPALRTVKPSPIVPAPQADEHDLLARRPKVIMQSQKNFEWKHDPEKREFSFMAGDLCLFQLGEAATADFGFEVVLSRTSADDIVGLYLGYRRGPYRGRPDIGRGYAFAIRPLDPELERRQGAALELAPFFIDFEIGNWGSLQMLFSVPILAVPLPDQRLRVQVERGAITHLSFGSNVLTDQVKSLPRPLDLTGGFGFFCKRGSGFVRSATLLTPK